MLLVAGVRCSFRGKDAGSVRSRRLRARPRTPHRGEQRGPAAQTIFRQTLQLGGGASELRRGADDVDSAAEALAKALERARAGLDGLDSPGGSQLGQRDAR
jgi:hypothetical protein